MTFIACMFFMLFGSTAHATVTFDPHYLVGSIHITNPAGQFKATHTVEFNTLHNTLVLCEIAKTAAETKAITVSPAANTANFGTFYKISTLDCVAK